jgi:hypothetical protein
MISRQQIIAVIAACIFASGAVESLVPPSSPSQGQRHHQFPSSLSIKSPTTSVARASDFSTPASSRYHIPTRSSAAAITSLSATSLDLSSSEIDEEDTKEIGVDESPNELASSVSKFRQLKDVMWIREAMEDWTAAEFALSVEQQSEGTSPVNNDDGDQSSPAAVSTNSKKSKKRAVDYEKLMSQLTKRIEDMTCQSFEEYTPVVDDDGVLKLDENLGMGRYAYTNEERMMLMEYVQRIDSERRFKLCTSSFRVFDFRYNGRAVAAEHV